MTIKWGNVLAVILIIVGIYVLVKIWPLLKDISSNIDAVSNHGDPTLGIIVLGIICLTIVGIVKIICNKR